MRARQIGLSVMAGSLSVSGQFLGKDGLASSPSYAFTSEPSLGWYRGATSDLRAAAGGNDTIRIVATQVILPAGSALSWGSSGVASPDVLLVRDAANVLALKNSTNAQTLRIYGTTTGPRYTSFTHNGSDMVIGNTGGGNIAFTSPTLWSSDNTLDIGAAGANRPRTCYLGTSLVIGAAQTQAAVTQSGAEGSSWTFTSTLTGSPTDFNGWTFGPTLNGAFTVTRFNYLDLRNLAGAATVTDAAAMRFDAAPGTHKALAANAAVAVTITAVGPTGAQTTIQGWIKMNINGTLRYVPFW